MKPFLILQLRALDGPSDNEFLDFLKYGALDRVDVHRIRIEKESFAHIIPSDYSAIIVGGGPSNVSDPESKKPEYQKRFEKELESLYAEIFEKDIPFLGLCYGFGSIAAYADAQISKERYAEEVGYIEIKLTEEGEKDVLLKGLPKVFNALCGHKEACQNLPKGAVLLGSSDTCPNQFLRFRQNIYATQFHCELDSSGIAERIRYYKNHGYFKPEEVEELIERTKNINTEIPHMILKRFVERYKT